jgi:hypothetical protein
VPVIISILVVLLVQVVPGLVVTGLVPQYTVGFSATSRLAMAVALSNLQLIVVCLVLVTVGVATTTWIVAANALVLVAGLLFLVVRRRADLGAAFRSVLGTRPSWHSVVVVLVFATVAALYVSTAFSGPPARTAGWGYAADVDAILSHGGIPERSVQYGEEVSFAVTKTAGFAWLASLRVLGGMDYLTSLRFLPLVILFTAMVAIWAIFRLFSGRLASALAIYLFFFPMPFGSVLAYKFSALTMESAGIALGFLAIWSMLASDRGGQRRLYGLTAVLLILTGLTHGIAALVTFLFIAAYQLAKLVAHGVNWREVVRGVTLLAVVPGLGILAALRLWSRASGFALSGGDFEFVAGGGDPTSALRRLMSGGSIDSVRAPVTGLDPGPGEQLDLLFRSVIGESSPLRSISQSMPMLILLLVLVLVVLAWFRGPRLMAASVGLFLIGLYASGLAFAARYDLHVYVTNPRRRQFPYAGLAVAALVVFAATWWLRHVEFGRLGVSAGTAALVVVLGWSVVYGVPRWTAPAMANGDIAALEWLRDNAPEDAIVLTNVRSTGSFGLFARHRSLTEGDAPYTFPNRLKAAISVLDSSQEWFADPEIEYLTENDISYVVVSRRPSQAMGGGVYARVDSTKLLRDQPYLVREAKFPRVVIFSVQRP